MIDPKRSQQTTRPEAEVTGVIKYGCFHKDCEGMLFVIVVGC